jgi:pimeloyl-ACP methyl ester carboxylesterase
VRTYSRPDGWHGAAGLYTSMLSEGDEIREIAGLTPLRIPTLAIGGLGGRFTENTLARVTTAPPKSVLFEGVGHDVAMEAPAPLAVALLEFVHDVDAVTAAR